MGTVALTYMVLNAIVSALKLYLTCNIVFYSAPASWSLDKIGGAYWGLVIDKVWFVFNAVIPLLVGFLRAFPSQASRLRLTVGHPLIPAQTEQLSRKPKMLKRRSQQKRSKLNQLPNPRP